MIRIVLEGLRGEESIAELCRREGINQNSYYKWSKEFLEAGKQRLAGETKRQATGGQVKALRNELEQGHRILSAYTLNMGIRVWIITEADRSSTTILLPAEY